MAADIRGELQTLRDQMARLATTEEVKELRERLSKLEARVRELSASNGSITAEQADQDNRQDQLEHDQENLARRVSAVELGMRNLVEQIAVGNKVGEYTKAVSERSEKHILAVLAHFKIKEAA